MPERVIKIILPTDQAEDAINLLKSQDNLTYWQEELSSKTFVASILTDSTKSEEVMDLFEKKFLKNSVFKLILFPVEASIPRIREEESTNYPSEEKSNKLRISREELYSDIVDSAKLNNIFVLMTILSTVVVSIGLLKNNVAVIIGAMVIAPYLGPNVALAFSSVLAEKKLGADALKTLITVGLIVVALSSGIGLIIDFDASIVEISSRTSIGYGEIILALASGAAGVLAFTTGASSAVIGVMVAVALLPPLAVFGLLIGAGEFSLALGALLLFLTNIICVNLSGIATFLYQGVSPRTWYDTDKARKATRRSLALWISTLVLLDVIIFIWSN